MVAARLFDLCGETVRGAALACVATLVVVHMGAVAAHSKAGQDIDNVGVAPEMDGGPARSIGYKGGRFGRPVVSDFSIDADGYVRVSGLCKPSHPVHIRLDGRLHRAVACDGRGRFVSKTLTALATGDHVVSTSVRLDGGRERFGNMVRVFIPPGFSSFAHAARPALTRSNHSRKNEADPLAIPDDVLDEAEELAFEASERFSELSLPGGVFDERAVFDDKTVLNTTAQLENNARVSNSEAVRDDDVKSNEKPNGFTSVFDYVVDANRQLKRWWQYSRESYVRDVVPYFRTGDGEMDNVALSDAPLPERPNQVWGFEGVRVDVSQYVKRTRNWFQHAANEFRSRIVLPLSHSDGVPTEARVVGAPRVADTEIAPSARVREPLIGEAASSSSTAHAIVRVSPPTGRFVDEPVSPIREPAIDTPQAGIVDPIVEPVEVDVERIPSVVGRYVVARPRKDTNLVVEPPTLPATVDPSSMPEEVNEKTIVARDDDASRDDEAKSDIEKVVVPPVPEKGAGTRYEFDGSNAVLAITLPNRNPRRRDVIARAPGLDARKGQAEQKQSQVVIHGAAELGNVLPPPKPDEYRTAFHSAVDEDILPPSRRNAGGSSRLGVRKITHRVVPKKRVASRKARKAKRRRVAVRSYQKRRKSKHQNRWRGSRKSRVYVVRKGDTLWDIAERYYGYGKCYKLIARANGRKVPNPHRIYPKQRLVVPRLNRRK